MYKKLGQVFIGIGVVGLAAFSLGIFWTLFLLLPILARVGLIIGVLGFTIGSAFSGLDDIWENK